MEGTTSANGWAKLPLAAVKRLVRLAAMRQLACLAMLAALLVPSLLAALPLSQSHSTCCGMACCKRTGACCCHRSKGHVHGGMQWKAGAKCSGGCGAASVAAPVVTLQAVLQASRNAAPILTRAAYQGLASHTLRFAGAGFSLFGRPPPAA